MKLEYYLKLTKSSGLGLKTPLQLFSDDTTILLTEFI